MPKYSRSDLERFKEEDYMLLDMALQDAKANGKKEFKVNIQAFDEVPNYEQHVWSWASKNGIDYSKPFDEFIFRID